MEGCDRAGFDDLSERAQPRQAVDGFPATGTAVAAWRVHLANPDARILAQTP